MKQRYIKTGGVRLWTVEQGSGMPILMINGGPGLSDYLAPLARVLEGGGRVIRFEQRGCGRSSFVEPYNVQTCIADIEGIRRFLNIKKWILLGHSWGAALALAYVLKHQSNSTALIYLSGTGITLDWKEEFHRNQREKSEIQPDCSFPTNIRVNVDGNESWQNYITQPALQKKIARLSIPSLILHGVKDLRPSWPAKELAKLIRGSMFKEIPGAEHIIWETHAKVLKEILFCFLEDIIPKSD
ncbi:alpha/beta fold hydrolase [Candidatus Riflebacteria bacterium]